MKTITFSIADLVCCGDARVIEQKLKVSPHIVEALVDFDKQLATITFHDNHLNEKKIHQIIKDCGFHCSRTHPLLSSKEAWAVAEHKLSYQDQHNHRKHKGIGRK